MAQWPNSKPTTIGELKKYLADMEAAWDAEDQKYLGKFDDQGLYIDTDKGIAQSFFQYHGEFGLITFIKERNSTNKEQV